MTRRVLVLGGTTEARELAAAVAALPGWAPVTSLAGRTSRPLAVAGRVRVGGFGGVAGLTAELAGYAAAVDATHPFAAAISANAHAAAAGAGVPLLALRRPGWTAGPGDDWRRVPSLDAAAAALPAGARVFLTTGRQGLGAFAGRGDCWFLSRSVEPPQPPVPPRLEVLLDRGPFDLAGERELLDAHRIGVLVTKDSGGPGAKLVAARERGVPVLVVDRPAYPDGPAVATVAAAVDWLARLP